MRFGACTWIMGDEVLPAKVERLAAIGLDGVELFGDLSLNPREAHKILADHQLAVLSLTPDNVDLCHPDATIHRPALDYYLRLIDFAAEVALLCLRATARSAACAQSVRMRRSGV